MILSLFIGVGIGWFIHPSPPQHPATAKAENAPSKRTTASPRNPVLQKFDVNKIADEGGKEFIEDLQTLSSEDLRALIDQFHAMGGFNGLTGKQKHIFDKIIEQWYRVDPTESIAWVNQLKNQKDQTEIITSLSKLETSEDLEKAIALIRDNLSPEDGYSLPFIMLQKAVEISEEKYLEVSKLSIASSSSWSSGDLNFPEGFDYPGVLSELTRQQKEAGDQLHGVSASNLMESWTKIDPEAAYEWLQENKATDGYRMKEFVEGLAAIRSPGELGTFLAADFDPQSTDYRKYDNIVQALTSKPDVQILQSFYENSEGDKTGIAEQMLQKFPQWGSDRLTELVLESLNPAERLEVLQSSKLDRKLEVQSYRENLKNNLIALGHSDKEIQQALAR